MAGQMYRVLEGQKYTGKHRVYCGEGAMGRMTGDTFPEAELFGNKDNLRMALEGSDDITDRYPTTKDKDGKDVPGKSFVAIKGKDAKIELVRSKEEKKASTPKRGRPVGSTVKDKD